MASSNGFEAIRLIHQEIEPSTGAASIGLLETILAIPEPPKGTPLRDSILAVERLFEDYEVSSTEKLSENLKIATLRKLLPAELKVHATLLVKDGVTYDQVKKAVTEYEVADRSFQALKPEAVYGGTIPMDVDAIQVRKVEKMASPHARFVARTTMVNAGPKASQAKVRPSKAMENLREKVKGKETRVELPHLRSVRSVARTTTMPRTASSATRGQFSKQAMLLRNLDHQVVRHLKPQHVQLLQIQQTSQIMLQRLENVKGLLQLKLRWQEPRLESLQPTSMACLYWIQVLMSTSVLQTLQNGSSL